MKTLIRLWNTNNNYWTQERSLTALLIYLFVSIISWLPLSERNPWEEAAQDFVFNLIVIAGYFSVSVDTSLRKGVLRQILLILAIMASVFRALEYFTIDRSIQQLDMITSIVYFLLLSILIFKFVVRDDKEVTAHRVQGAIVVYILVGLVCSFIYNLIYLHNPNAFTFIGHDNDDILYAYFIYFSFTVQTTVGAGDIIPGDAWSKSVVIFQSMMGMLYPVVIIARLVSLEIEHSKAKKNNQQH